ncbi:MAG: ATP-binding cassette domain-containing protein [Flavobacteriales bacterium]|nr:ATP-binding cassette domain-containing protein [Flavobacteriales bacterium]
MSSEVVIDLRNLKIQQQKNLILDGVNLQVKKGEFIYLIGKTGSGKSSLLRTLYRDIELNGGEGTIVGFDLHKIKTRKIPHLRRKLGIVFQDFQLLTDRSIEDNLLFVMKATGWKDKKKMNEQVKKMLEMVNLETKGYKMPHEISGGEQQRAAIARALINNPEVIIADEPTGNLDTETSESILQLLLEISRKGKAVLFATHDSVLMDKYPARTLKCEGGKLTEMDSNSIGGSI